MTVTTHVIGRVAVRVVASIQCIPSADDVLFG